MGKARAWLALCLSLPLLTAVVEAADQGSYTIDASVLRRSCAAADVGLRNDCGMYGLGVVDYFHSMSPSCWPVVTPLQAADIVASFLGRHPDWDNAAGVNVVLVAFSEAYPCPVSLEPKPAVDPGVCVALGAALANPMDYPYERQALAELMKSYGCLARH